MVENKTDVLLKNHEGGIVGKFTGIPIYHRSGCSYEKLDKVIAAYEWCWNENKHESDCSGCPYCDAPEGCNKQVDMDTLDLLKEFREFLKFGVKYGRIEFGNPGAEDLDAW